jgi:hypothetical protein
MSRDVIDIGSKTVKLRVPLLISLLIGLAAAGHGETLTVSRRLVRFDGKPATPAKVRVLSDYGTPNKTDLEVMADADGVFSAEVTQENAQWGGHIIVSAEGCATTCEVAVTGRRKDEPLTPELRLGAPFRIEGRTMDTAGRPVAEATVVLVWARPHQWNETAFNSTMTHPITTPEFIAHSTTNGTWSMPGIDFVLHGVPTAATVAFEASVDKPLRAATLDVQLDPKPGRSSRPNVSLNFTLAPLIHVTGRVINSTTGQAIAGAGFHRNVIFTTLAGPPALTDAAGRFELHIPGPQPLLWFNLYRDGFASTTVKTARRTPATSDWPKMTNLIIRLRPLVTVAGTVRDENGQPPDEPLVLDAKYEERIDADWDQGAMYAASESKVSADGSFNAKLPAGQITVSLRRPPQPMGSITWFGMPPKNYRLEQPVEIPVGGMRGLQLKARRGFAGSQ